MPSLLWTGGLALTTRTLTGARPDSRDLVTGNAYDMDPILP